MNTDNPPWMHIATIFPSYSTPPILALRGLGPVKTTLTMSNSTQKLKPTNLFNAPTAMGVVRGGQRGASGLGGKDAGMCNDDGYRVRKTIFFLSFSSWKEKMTGEPQQASLVLRPLTHA